MIYLLLFLEFFKVGLFTVGGGLASLPFLYEISDKYAWFTHTDITNMIAISEATPGPIGVNMATYVGYHTGGVLGGIVATLAIILPECIIVLTLANYLQRYKESPLVQAGFQGIRPAVTAMITVALISVLKVSVLSWDAFFPGFHWGELINLPGLLLFGAALFLVLKYKKHPLWYILGGAVVGIFIAP